MSVLLTIQNIAQAEMPDAQTLTLWVEQALPQGGHFHINVRVVSQDEIQHLNHQYRHKDKPTNVLSFPNMAPPELSEGFLGDMVICADVLAQEAKDQNKPLNHHWAHMIIHSTLHLQGYDHQNAAEADEMESLEIKLLSELGYANPYAEENHE